MAEFRCPSCGNPRTGVTDSRPTAAFRTRRRRLCKCGHRFTTIELPTEEYSLLELDGSMVAKLRRDAKKVTDTIDAIVKRQSDVVRERINRDGGNA